VSRAVSVHTIRAVSVQKVIESVGALALSCQVASSALPAVASCVPCLHQVVSSITWVEHTSHWVALVCLVVMIALLCLVVIITLFCLVVIINIFFLVVIIALLCLFVIIDLFCLVVIINLLCLVVIITLLCLVMVTGLPGIMMAPAQVTLFCLACLADKLRCLAGLLCLACLGPQPACPVLPRQSTERIELCQSCLEGGAPGSAKLGSIGHHVLGLGWIIAHSLNILFFGTFFTWTSGVLGHAYVCQEVSVHLL